MKFIFLLGGAAGFTLAAGTDFLVGRNPDRILFDGAVGCLVGAVLLRWFWNVVLSGMRETYVTRQRAALAAAAAPAASAPAGPAAAAPRPPQAAPAPAAPRSGPAAAAATAAAIKRGT